MDISTALARKAQRLVDADRVSHVKGFMYRVRGDSDTYDVHLSYPEEVLGRCNCPSTAKVCSHILAASIVYLADPPTIVYLADPPTVTVPTTDPFEGLN